jgi:DNA-binding transcriptional LysR family regulator
MTLIQLRAFVQVADSSRGIYRTSEDNDRAFNSLYMLVRSLEKDMGLKLFERTHRPESHKKWPLTEEGQIFLTHAKKAIKELDLGVIFAKEYKGFASGAGVTDPPPDHALR